MAISARLSFAALAIGGLMVSHSVLHGDTDTDHDIGTAQLTEVAALVRRLAALVGAMDPAIRPGCAPGVLLDLELGEVRCRLEAVQPVAVAAAVGPLSPREVEVARMVAQGYPNKTIATVLEISSFTVSSYLRRIFAKLGVNSRAAMVAAVIENHLLPQVHPEPAAPAAVSRPVVLSPG